MIKYCASQNQVCVMRGKLPGCVDQEPQKCNDEMKKVCANAGMECEVINGISVCTDRNATICDEVLRKKCKKLGKECDDGDNFVICKDPRPRVCPDEKKKKCAKVHLNCIEIKGAPSCTALRSSSEHSEAASSSNRCSLTEIHQNSVHVAPPIALGAVEPSASSGFPDTNV
ncbi:uncharacterized protein LOC125945701 [Dermacentor silvarum]|uniref:uncharacterized protein LOC125945701 n=1 Tax=Dermacentor silvarum TaxID=543639 RepID=UPI002101CDFC|nr:uncharacterized protein LOC125945701 [Dermacentor silvarum]